MTLRGALTIDTTDCFATAAFNVKGSISFNAEASKLGPDFQGVSAVAQFEGPPAAGTYSKANAFHTSAIVKMTDGTQYMASYWEKGPTYPDLPEWGSVQITVDSVSVSGVLSQVRGTVTATLVKVVDGGVDETATITLTATF